MPRLFLVPERGADRRRSPFFHTKKIAILGNTHSINFAPWHDASWTLLAHPCCRAKCHREPDWYFDLHGPQNYKTQRKAWTDHYYTWLKNLQTPIFMQQAWPEIPMAVEFPRMRLLSEFRDYFTNHTAWMIALAITEGATHIGLFGCEYKHEQERSKQRGSAEYWLGFIDGRGLHSILPPGASLLHDPPEEYGYESHDEHGKLKPSYLTTPTISAIGPTGHPLKRELKIVDPHTAEGRIPLMKLPDGELPNWERSGHLIHA